MQKHGRWAVYRLVKVKAVAYQFISIFIQMHISIICAEKKPVSSLAFRCGALSADTGVSSESDNFVCEPAFHAFSGS